MINMHSMDVLPALVNSVNTVNPVNSNDNYSANQLSTRLPSKTPKRANTVYCWLSYFLLLMFSAALFAQSNEPGSARTSMNLSSVPYSNGDFVVSWSNSVVAAA